MYAIEHKGYFVISQGNQYLAKGKGKSNLYFTTKDISHVLKWTKLKKAENFFNNSVPKSIQENCQIEQIDIKPFTVNKDLLNGSKAELLNNHAIPTSINYISVNDWIDYINHMLESYDDLSVPLINAQQECSKADRALSDISHYIEFGKFNCYQAYKIFELQQALLRYRRTVKDICYVLENLSLNHKKSININDYSVYYSTERIYKPRVFNELFVVSNKT